MSGKAQRRDIPPDVYMLLVDIYNWMSENDYECGDQGSKLWEDIRKTLDASAPPPGMEREF